MGWIKNTLISALFLSTLLVPRIVRAGAISGRIFNSHNGQTSDSTLVDVIINDGTSGTEHSQVPEWGDYGLWIVDSGNFSPIPGIGDTVKMSGQLNNYTTHMRDTLMVAGSPHNGILPTAFLDDPDKNVRAHSFGSWSVKDTSGINDTLRAEGYLLKNSEQVIPYINYFLKAVSGDSTLVDTSDIYPQVAINLEKQDSLWQQGDSVFVRLYKERNDSTWETTIGFPLDTLKYGCATLLDSIIFPDTVYTPTGIQETMTDFTARTIEDVVNLGVRLDFKTNQTGIIDIDKNGKDLTRIITEPNKVNYTFVDRNVKEGRNYNYQAIFRDDTLTAIVHVPHVAFKVKPTITKSKIEISGAKEVDVYGLDGRKVGEYKNSSSTGTYDLDVPQGIYFLKTKGSSEETKKVVKLK